MYVSMPRFTYYLTQESGEGTRHTRPAKSRVKVQTKEESNARTKLDTMHPLINMQLVNTSRSRQTLTSNHQREQSGDKFDSSSACVYHPSPVVASEVVCTFLE